MSANTLRRSNYDVDGFINQLLASEKFDQLADKVADKAVDKIRLINGQPTHLQRSNTNDSVMDYQAKDQRFYPNKQIQLRSRPQNEYKEESNEDYDKDISAYQDKKTSSREYDRESSIHEDKYREASSKEYEKESSRYQDEYRGMSSKEYHKLRSILQDKYREKSKEYDKEPAYKNRAVPDPTFEMIDSKAIMKKKIISDPSDLKLNYKYLTRNTRPHDDRASNSGQDPVLKNEKPEETYKGPVTENVKTVALEETHFHDNGADSGVYNQDISDKEKERQYSDNEKKADNLDEGDKNNKKPITAKKEKVTKVVAQSQEENTKIEQITKQNETIDGNTKPLKSDLPKLVEAETHSSIKFIPLKEYSVSKSNQNIGEKNEETLADKNASPMLRAHNESDNVEENKVYSTSDESRKGSGETRIKKPPIRKEGNKLYTFVQAPEYEEYLEEVEKEKKSKGKEVDLYDTF